MLLLVGQALAGSGPWVVGEASYSLYVGTEAQRLNNLAIHVDGERTVLPVGQGLQAFGVKAIGSIGLGSRMELQLTVPWSRVQTSRPDDPLCVQLGLGACNTTQGVGIVSSRLKGLLLNEFFGAPVSLAIGGELRNGDFTADTRERITNLGEGSVDLGPFVDIGRTGMLGQGYWSAWIEGQFRYRLPNTRSYPNFEGDVIAPGSEFLASTEWVFGPRTYVAFGPQANLLWRPFGLDWDELDLGDPDRFGALRVTNARVGAVAIVRASQVTGAVSVLRTVYAFNNPTDTLYISVGLQFAGRLPGVGDG